MCSFYLGFSGCHMWLALLLQNVVPLKKCKTNMHSENTGPWLADSSKPSRYKKKKYILGDFSSFSQSCSNRLWKWSEFKLVELNQILTMTSFNGSDHICTWLEANLNSFKVGGGDACWARGGGVSEWGAAIRTGSGGWIRRVERVEGCEQKLPIELLLFKTLSVL